MTTERIDIVVSERGAPTVSRQIAQIGDAAERSATQTNRLKNALAGLATGTGIAALARLVDSYTNLTNRLRTVTKGAGELKLVQNELFNIASRNRVAADGVAQVYQRFAVVLKAAGRSTSDTLSFVDTLTKSVVLSGASTQEATAALVQFGQALGANFKGSGQEINSILEQLPILADAIAERFGIARFQLKKFVQEGKISSMEVIEAVENIRAKWTENFNALAPTMEQALGVIKTRLGEAIGQMDATLGASENIAKAMMYVADNIKILLGAVTTLATALGITLVRYGLEIVIGRLLDFIRVLAVAPVVAFTTAIMNLSIAFAVLGRSAVLSVFSGLAATFTRIGTVATGLMGILRSLAGALAFKSLSNITLLSFARGLASVGTAALTLLNPLSLVRGAAGLLTTVVGGGLALAFRTAMASISAAVTVIGGIASTFFSVAKIIGILGVAMITMGDQTTIAQNSLVTYRDVALSAWERIKTAFSSMIEFVVRLWPSFGEGADKSFKVTEMSFKDMLKSVAGGIDYFIAVFKTAREIITDDWQLLFPALVDVIIKALKAMWDMIGTFINKALSLLGDFVSKLLSGDFTAIASGALDFTVEGAADRLGKTFSEKLQENLAEGGGAVKELDRILEDSNDRAISRMEEERIAFLSNQAAKLQAAQQGAVTIGGGAAEDEERKPKEFGDYLNELQREQQLGLATGDAYKILNEQLDIANKLRRELTDSEKNQIATAVENNAQLERKRALLTEIVGPEQEYGYQIQALNALLNEGAINVDQYNQQFLKLRENFINGLPEATTFADGFAIQMEKMKLATQNGMGQMGTEVGKIFGPGGTLVNGIGDAIAQSIVFGKSFKEQIRGVAQSILSQLIGSLVKMGLNMVLNATLGQTLMTAQTATGVAQAGALTAAYTPAAAMASLATGGANAAAAGTGISSIFSLLAGLAGSLFGGMGGFSEGGFTGAIGTSDVAGVVHGQEFVINANATKRHRSLLEAINAGKDPMTPFVAAAATAAPVNVSITNEIPDAAFEVRPLGEQDIEIIARRIVRREAAEVVAQDLRNPNSRTSKGISSNTTAHRKR